MSFRASEELNTHHVHSYCPYYNDGIIRRQKILADWIERERPISFHIDVSTEIADFVALFGIPFTYIRQAGIRKDRPHLRTYDMAQRILAPFPKELENSQYLETEHSAKSFYAPVYSEPRSQESHEQKIVLYIRSSTSSMPSSEKIITDTLLAKFPMEKIYIAGTPLKSCEMTYDRNTGDSRMINLGWVPNVYDYAVKAKIILASAGDNLSQELLRLNRPVVFLAEDKSYEEQLQKCMRIQKVFGHPFVNLATLTSKKLSMALKESLQQDRDLSEFPLSHSEQFAKKLLPPY